MHPTCTKTAGKLKLQMSNSEGDGAPAAAASRLRRHVAASMGRAAAPALTGDAPLQESGVWVNLSGLSMLQTPPGCAQGLQGAGRKWWLLVLAPAGTQICFAHCQSLWLVGFRECPGLAESSSCCLHARSCSLQEGYPGWGITGIAGCPAEPFHQSDLRGQCRARGHRLIVLTQQSHSIAPTHV